MPIALRWPPRYDVYHSIIMHLLDQCVALLRLIFTEIGYGCNSLSHNGKLD